MPQPAEIIVNHAESISSPATPQANWKKELAEATISACQLLKRLNLEAHLDLVDERSNFRCLVTESFIKKMQPGNINDPLLRQALPLAKENYKLAQHTGTIDPVGDINSLASPGLLHKYHGRALLISTGACAIHCRYCFRRHFPYQDSSCNSHVLEQACDYLKQHPEIDEIILSGGDPLVLDDEKLAALVTRLETVTQLSTLRIHTRLPVVLPERISSGLLQLIQSSRFNVVMVIHSNHANELQHAEYTKLLSLHEAGVTLLNQSVLLKGINDTAESLTALSKRLLQCRTLPYYLHLLDPVKGAMHFEVDRKYALELIRQIQQHLPGYLVPKLVQEIAGKPSKTAIFRI
jgi:EF-P beta-lysylation protein EpmB